MSEKAQEYLDRKRRECGEISREERASFLLKEDPWEKECAPDENASRSLYPETDENGRWRRVPLQVTEEELAEIVRLSGFRKQSVWAAALLGGVLGVMCFGQAAILQALNRR